MDNRIITAETVKTIIEKRKREIHKGDCGRILITAGSLGMAGAAVLAARGALRAGSGLVQVAVPTELFPIVQVGVPEATCLERDFSNIDFDRYDAAAIGPGLGESDESVKAVRHMVENFDGTLVLDADALNIISHNNFFGALRNRAKGTTIITPHLGEASRLLGKNLKGACREEIVKELYEKTGAVSVLKGHATLVAVSEEKTYTNTTGNPGMATAGSGDVLTGIITSLAGQKRGSGELFTAEEAALCGVFIHGLAGDLAAETTGEYGLVAGDLAYYTALALKKLTD